MDLRSSSDLSRRRFVQSLAASAAAAALGHWTARAGEPAGASATAMTGGTTAPWYRRAGRWGQVNLTEVDPARIDLGWLRDYWRRTAVQGVVVNAGGIVAYYPTDVPFHRRARTLGDRDLFGEICRIAQADGLAVFARMDSNRADEACFRARPEWFARDARGEPYRVTDLYVACVNSGYYHDHIPAILREVAGRYRPQGFTDNNWNGPMRNQPCFCANCTAAFRARTGRELPRAADWNDPLYREWIRWNYERRIGIWDEFNAITRAAGGPECIWVGMMAGSQNWQARVFRDDRELYRRAALVMLDHQRRPEAEGFSDNAQTGLRIHAAGGWDKIVPESTALYQAAEHNFRLAAKPEPEVRLWALEGFAGGIQPWWHFVGSQQPDARILETAAPLLQWHRAHERHLVHRMPIATVGLLWSQRNMDFFGRDDAGPLVDDPWNGMSQALLRARIPSVPVHVDDVPRIAAELGLKLLILPNVAALSDPQLGHLRDFVRAGGSVFATGASTLCDEEGQLRADFGLADVFGVHVPPGHVWRDDRRRGEAARAWQQTYLRLVPSGGPTPDARGTVTGPVPGRHEVLRGFDATDVIAFGGTLEPLVVDPGATVPLTLVPAVPSMPVESVWMREPVTALPGLILREHPNGARVALLPADLDRRFARDYLPDHGDLLANIVRWALRDELPLRVTGAGVVDCRLYRQRDRLVLHLVNLTNPGTWRSPVHELIRVGPLQVRVRCPTGVAGSGVLSLVSDRTVAAVREDGWLGFELSSVLDHEVLVIG